MTAAPESTRTWQVVCLCAEWCGVCREWRAAFERVAAANAQLSFSWVDIEDEAQALGDVDVETFPTLLVAHQGQPVFYGPVPPSQAQFERLLASLQGSGGGVSVPSEAGPLLRRLEAHVLAKS